MSAMHPRLSVVLFLCAGTTAAQGVILPSAMAVAPPVSNAYGPNPLTFVSMGSHTQLIYDVNDVPTVAATWTSLQFRPERLGAALAASGYANVKIGMSPAAYGAASSVFANNLVSNVVTVISSTIALPAIPGNGTWPAPWAPAIPFALPYVYVKPLGQSLVVDLDVPAFSGGAWALEQTSIDKGRAFSNLAPQLGCKFGTGAYSRFGGGQGPAALGKPWSATFTEIPVGMAGFVVLGASGGGGSWGGLGLPLDLTPFGAPGCSWAVSAEYAFPVVSVPPGQIGTPTITVPTVPSLAGSIFYHQAVLLDPTANPWGVVTTFSMANVIGSGRGAPGAFVWFVNSSAQLPKVEVETVSTIKLN